MRFEERLGSLKRRITETWDHGAEGYDDQYGHVAQSPAEADAWALLIRRLLPPDVSLHVLDVGTGTGFLALLLAELGHTVTAVDLSERMLDVARRKAEAAALAVDFRVADAADLPFDDHSFQAVVSRHLLWTLIEPERAVAEWARVTQPGGRTLAIDGLDSRSRADRAAARAGSLLRRLRRRDSDSDHDHSYPDEAYASLPLLHLRSLEPVRNVFARAGLRDIRTEDLRWIDRIEKREMPLHERLLNRYHRYLIEGTVP